MLDNTHNRLFAENLVQLIVDESNEFLYGLDSASTFVIAEILESWNGRSPHPCTLGKL
jgi:hypothetical protein